MLASQGCKQINRGKVKSPKTVEVKQVEIAFDLQKLKIGHEGHSDDRYFFFLNYFTVSSLKSIWCANATVCLHITCCLITQKIATNRV